MPTCRYCWLGTVEYLHARQLQDKLVNQVHDGQSPDTLLMLEHPHVYTRGRLSRDEHLLTPDDQIAALGVPVHETDRGGQVTYHGPGQLVGYPIINLRRLGIGPLQYVRTLEQVIIGALSDFDIPSHTEPGLTGVWTEGGKIAAIGVKISRGVAFHGFALNVNTDLAYYRHIVPCGITGRPVTSMAVQLGRSVGMMQVRDAVVVKFGVGDGLGNVRGRYCFRGVSTSAVRCGLVGRLVFICRRRLSLYWRSLSVRLRKLSRSGKVAEQLKCSYTSETGEFGYLLYLPGEYHQSAGRRWPLVVFLHGWGESGDDLELLKYHGIPRLIEDSSDFPFVVVSPQAPVGVEWQELTAPLSDFVRWVADNYLVDRNRISLTGLSTGGKGVWALAVENPDLFAAIAPMAADIPQVERFLDRVQTLRHLPVWVFHGARDDIYPAENTDAIVERLKSVNGNVRYTVYPDANHISWNAAYGNPELYQWLFEQSR